MTAAVWLRLSPSLDSVGVAPAIGLVAGTLMAGAMGQRRQKAALVAGLGLLAAALWRLAAVPAAQWWMGLISGALGLGIGMAFLTANAVVSAASPGSRATSLTLLNLPLPAGVLLNPVVSPETMVRATAAVATLALIAAAWRPSAPSANVSREIGAGRNRRAVAHLGPLLFLYVVCEAATWNWLVRYMGAAHVLDRETAWLILSYGLPLGLMVGRAGCSRMLVKIAPATVVRMASFTMAFATALLLLARSPSACWIAGFLVGLAMSPVLPATLAMAGDGLGMGMVLAAGWIGLAVSSPLIAWIAERSSLPTAMVLLPVFSFGTAALTERKAVTGEETPGRNAG
jgi:hypothetical protein